MKFVSKSVEEHPEVPLADKGLFEENTEYWQRREIGRLSADGGHRAYVVSVALYKEEFPLERQSEILALVKAQGDCIAGQEIARITKPDPRALFRSGRAAEIAMRARKYGAELLVVDAELSPSQCRNLEDMTGLAVRDRESVILHVFQKNIKTRRAKIQVEIAHLEYLRPRIRGLGLEMDQQAGGVIGSRGAGETASELLARQLDFRLAVLRKSFAGIAKERKAQRKRRSRSKRISLIGYTNAGKTSLMNGLTMAGLSAVDAPFETLDTTSRCLSRYGGDVVIHDTVGFIRDLPERLFASFASTLAEIQESDLLVLVVDISSAEAAMHLRTTEEMMVKLSVVDFSRLVVFTKVDCCLEPPSERTLSELSQGHPYVVVNARCQLSVDRLKNVVLRHVRNDEFHGTLFVPYESKKAMTLMYTHARIEEAKPVARGVVFVVALKHQWLSSIKKAIENEGVSCQ